MIKVNDTSIEDVYGFNTPRGIALIEHTKELEDKVRNSDVTDEEFKFVFDTLLKFSLKKLDFDSKNDVEKVVHMNDIHILSLRIVNKLRLEK